MDNCRRVPRRRFLLSLGAAAAGASGVTSLARFAILPKLGTGQAPRRYPKYVAESAGGWHKYGDNPVLGGHLGTCFDACVLLDGGIFRMWFSWRPEGSIAHTYSPDGIHWSPPSIVLAPIRDSPWEPIVNRPSVLKGRDGYHLWYTGQTNNASAVGYARSTDGLVWKRHGEPVLSAEQPWERPAIMAPTVLWDASMRKYRMWYSGGMQFEPNAIGYADSPDGVTWSRHEAPVFRPAQSGAWDENRVTAPQVLYQDGWYVMLYIGFFNEMSAQIGMARSRDGLTWHRYPGNPILRPSQAPDRWDYDAVYRPWAVKTGHGWMLWYNGRRGASEQIGLAYHPGPSLWA